MRLVKCPFSISYIKRSDTPHYQQDVSFEVPISWEWCKLGTVNEIARGGSPRPIKDYLTNDVNGINWIKIGDTTKDGKYIDSVKERIRPEGLKKSRLVHKGDFLLTNSMSFGRPYILNVDGCIHDGWLVISPIGEAYMSDFLYYLLSSSYAFEQFTNVASGGVVTNLNSDKVADIKFPLPPLAEQKRIVVKIERWFALIDHIEQSQSDLQDTIRQTKSKILDLAIHGKLVPQDPNDKPASELLKRINPKAEITCDNGHYPLGWCKTQLKYIADYVNGRAFKPEEWETNGIPIVRIQNLNDEAAPYNKSSKSYEEKYLIHEGDLLFAWAASLGTYIWEKGDAWLNQHIFKVIPFVFMDKLYLYYSLESLIKDFYKESHGSGMVHITKKKFEDIECFVPPLSEQQRIVAKIEELFSILDKIKKALEA